MADTGLWLKNRMSMKIQRSQGLQKRTMPFAITIPLGCIVRTIVLPTSRRWTNDGFVGTGTPYQIYNPIEILVVGKEELSDISYSHVCR